MHYSISDKFTTEFIYKNIFKDSLNSFFNEGKSDCVIIVDITNGRYKCIKFILEDDYNVLSFKVEGTLANGCTDDILEGGGINTASSYNYDDKSFNKLLDYYIKDIVYGMCKVLNRKVFPVKVNKRKIVTLCGSTRFKDEFIKAQEEFTLKGYIVLTVGLFGHADHKYDDVITPEVKLNLDQLHKDKISMSDEIYVINKGGYIGESTKSEIEHARILGKEISYLEPLEGGHNLGT